MNPQNLLTHKISFIQKFIEKEKISAFFFSKPANIFYLSGFHSTHAYILITLEKNYFLTDSRYFEKAKEELKNWEVILIEGNTFTFLKKFFKSLNLKTIGFEKEAFTIFLREKLRTKGLRFKGFLNPLKPLRMIKLPQELEILVEGIKKTDLVYEALLKKNSLNDTELSLRGKLVYEGFKMGFSGESFPAIIASGEHSSVPHWESGNFKIKIPAPLLIDMGFCWKGYMTDFTRTIYLGKPEKEFLNHYEMVKTAFFKALEKVKVGERIGKIDEEVREYFHKKGVLKHFLHATGHGIGVEIHEAPRVYFKEKEVIQEGMVFTIEPGLYFEGKWGIRLENIIIVKDGKGEVVSKIPLDLQIVEI